MFIRVKGRAVPPVLLVISSLWMAAFALPLFYSLCFPNADILHVVRAFEGKEALRSDLAPLAHVTNSVGRLKRAIPVAAYFGAATEYKHGESHSTKTTQLSYLAWFEKLPKPTILIVSRTQVDGSKARFETDEGSIFGMVRIYMLPVVPFALSLWWFVRTRSAKRSLLEASKSFVAAVNPEGQLQKLVNKVSYAREDD